MNSLDRIWGVAVNFYIAFYSKNLINFENDQAGRCQIITVSSVNILYHPHLN